MFRIEKQRTFGLNTMQGTNKLSHLEMIGHQLISLTRRQIAKTSYTTSSETAVAGGADCPSSCGGLTFLQITAMLSHNDKFKTVLRKKKPLSTPKIKHLDHHMYLTLTQIQSHLCCLYLFSSLSPTMSRTDAHTKSKVIDN